MGFKRYVLNLIFLEIIRMPPRSTRSSTKEVAKSNKDEDRVKKVESRKASAKSGAAEMGNRSKKGKCGRNAKADDSGSDGEGNDSDDEEKDNDEEEDNNDNEDENDKEDDYDPEENSKKSRSRPKTKTTKKPEKKSAMLGSRKKRSKKPRYSETKYPCDECDYVSYSKDSRKLKRHKECVHSDEKP